MRQTLTIALNDLRIFLVDRGNLISLLLVPIAMTLIIGFVSGGSTDSGPERVRVDLLDIDQSELSREFTAALREANSALALCPLDDAEFCQIGDDAEFDRDWALSRLQEETSLAAIEIPAGFAEDVRAFRPVKIIFWSLEDSIAPGYIQQAVEAAIQQINGAVVASMVGSEAIASFPGVNLEAAGRQDLQRALYDRAADLWAEEPVAIDYQLSGQPETPTAFQNLQAGLGQSVPGMGAMFVMFTVFGGMTALIEERKQWTLPRLATLPISKAQLLGGKILARFTLGLLQYLIIFLVGALLGMNFGDDPLALVLLALTYTLAVTALSFALGTRLENESQASGLSLLLSLILAPLGGAWWPLEIVPDFMRAIGHISPVAWAMDGFTALLFESAGLADIWVPMVVLLAIALVCFFLAIRLFRYD